MALAIWQRTIVDDRGNALAGASVEVRLESTGALAPLKSDRAGTTVKANPFNADAEGFAQFYAAGGNYRITATSGGLTKTWRYVAIGLELDSISLTQFGAKGDGTQNDKPYIDAAMAYAAGRPIWVPRGIFRCTEPLAAQTIAPRFIGEGYGQTTSPAVYNEDYASAFLLDFDGAYLFDIDLETPPAGNTAPINFENVLIFSESTMTGGGGIKATCSTGGLGVPALLRNCALTGLYDGAWIDRSSGSRIEGGIFTNNVRNALRYTQSGGFEGAIGDIIGTTFDQYTTNPEAVIFSEVGYAQIVAAKIVGGVRGVHLKVPAGYSAGRVEVMGGQLEEQTTYGIVAESNGGGTASMLKVSTQFSNMTQSGLAAHVAVLDYGGGTDWIDSVVVSGCVLRSQLGNSSKYVSIASGKGVKVTDNHVRHSGAGTAIAFEVKGAGVKAPADVLDNTVDDASGTLSKRYDLQSTVLVRDPSITRALLPATCADGSTAFVTDGAPGTAPVSVGAGTFALRLGGTWRGDAGPAVNGITFNGSGSTLNVDGGKTGRFKNSIIVSGTDGAEANFGANFTTTGILTINGGSSTINIDGGKTFRSMNTLTLAGSADGYTVTFPGTGTVALQSYVDSAVAGLLDDRGNYNASGNVFPSTGGSGAAGAITKGDIWIISVAGTLGGVAVAVGDQVRALVDTPGQTAANWAISEANIGYVPLNQASNLSDLLNAATARSNLGLGNVDNTSDATKNAAAVTLTNKTLTAPNIDNIVFPATQVPSADPNTLDDYEEFTWTPVLTFATPGDLNVAYAANFQNGWGTKVGRLVTVHYVVMTSTFTHTTASGALRITGLPFTAVSTTNFFHFGGGEWAGVTKAGYTQVTPGIANNTAIITFNASGSGQALSVVSAADMPTGGTVILVGTVSYVV